MKSWKTVFNSRDNIIQVNIYVKMYHKVPKTWFRIVYYTLKWGFCCNRNFLWLKLKQLVEFNRHLLRLLRFWWRSQHVVLGIFGWIRDEKQTSCVTFRALYFTFEIMSKIILMLHIKEGKKGFEGQKRKI